jgi:hypothetical protein
MDITELKLGEYSLIEFDDTSSNIAWLHRYVTGDMTEDEVIKWCENFYETQKLTPKEQAYLFEFALEHPKNVPPDFLFRMVLTVELIYKLIKKRQKEDLEKKPD